MTDQMKNLLILLCGIAVVLLVVIILFAGKSPFMKLMSYFLEEQDDSESGRHSNNVNTSQKSRKNQDAQGRNPFCRRRQPDASVKACSKNSSR